MVGGAASDKGRVKSAGDCAAVWLEGGVVGDSMAGPGELEMILKE